MIPGFGTVIAAASMATRQFMNALDETAKHLASYSGQLAVAQAQAENAQVQGDLRRARLLGGDLARFTEARSQLSQSGQDLMAQVLKDLTPTAIEITEMLKDILDTIKAFGEKTGVSLGTAIQGLAGGLGFVPDIYRALTGVERNTRPRLDADDAPLTLGDLLLTGVSDANRQRAVAGLPGRDDRGRQRGPNFPILGGS